MEMSRAEALLRAALTAKQYLRHVKNVKASGSTIGISFASSYLGGIKTCLSLDPKGPPHYHPPAEEKRS